jgi:hypothetical protein
LADCLSHVGLAAVTLLAWFGLGSLVLARGPRVADPWLDVLNRIGAGALSFALLTFGAGWARLLYPAIYLPVFALAAAVGAATTGGLRGRVGHLRLGSWARWEVALLILLVAYATLDLVATSAPVSSPDALLYHVSNPALFAKAHRIFAIPWNSSSYEPFSMEMLVLDGILLWNPVQGAFAPLLMAILALVAVVGFTRRLVGRGIALLAGAILFAQPLMVWEATSAFIESGIAFVIALAAWNVYEFARTSRRGSLALAGLFAGGAAGMKYLGLIAALTLVVAAAVVLLRRVTYRTALTFGAPAVAVALPWYIKNAVLTGNPFYPHLFGGLNESAQGELSYTMQTFGYGRSALDLVLLPARLLVAAKPFDGGQYLSPLFVIFAPLALIASRRRPSLLVAFGGVLLYVAIWFVTTQQARFLVPAMPVSAVLAALGVRALSRESRLGRLLAVVVTVGTLAVGLGASAVYAAQFAPVVFGRQATTQFLREKVSNFTGIEWLNQNLGPHTRVATDVWALLYLHMPYVTFGTMGDLLPPDAGPKATRAFVARYGITDVAILDNDVARRRQVSFLHARLIGRVPVRSVQSRTRGHFGPRHDMLVYAVGPA